MLWAVARPRPLSGVLSVAAARAALDDLTCSDDAAQMVELATMRLCEWPRAPPELLRSCTSHQVGGRLCGIATHAWGELYRTVTCRTVLHHAVLYRVMWHGACTCARVNMCVHG